MEAKIESKVGEGKKMDYDYDMIVIGGGSGGMSCAKQAASLGAKVVLFDFVKPSTQGTKWGLGGTCVNVGCVPKKLMHYAGLLGEGFHDAKELGWSVNAHPKHDWNKLVETVSNHVHSLNFTYRNALRSNQVTYINALAEFVDPHTIVYKEKDGRMKNLTAETIVIAVGGRPFIPTEIDGALQHAITSDDIFTLERPPGKTLCVGGSYISLECAGFLLGLGYEVTISVRTTVLLRGFDRQCAEKIGTTLQENGAVFNYNSVVTSIDKTPQGRYQVVFYNTKDNAERMELFDTVLFATGRSPDLSKINLSSTGVHVNTNLNNIMEHGKVSVDQFNRTNVSNIYAIGDICENTPELTPVAIKAGELLAKRLYSLNPKDKRKFIDYKMVPTTVFTPMEYGSIGFSEEEAIAKFGEENIEVYLSEFTTLELSSVHRLKKKRNLVSENISETIVNEEEEQEQPTTGGQQQEEDEPEEDDSVGPNCLAKLICLKNDNEKVIGFHYVGPNAGEITQVTT
jgi:thioredoxin/glutathione reductase (selenoprotein)